MGFIILENLYFGQCLSKLFLRLCVFASLRLHLYQQSHLFTIRIPGAGVAKKNRHRGFPDDGPHRGVIFVVGFPIPIYTITDLCHL
jgi:hypothetical protein